ncbi:MAG: HDOD domain-containing protein [Chthonomonas sp.]|nr:HDOD domain-containing protein [Chthonomonas sp.]
METDKQNSLEEILSKVREIAVLPQVVHQLMEITESTDGSPADIEKAVGIDPGFTAKLLTIANSAQFALPRKVVSLREACMLLGFKQIRTVALSAGVFDLFVGKTDKESVRRRDWWKFSIDTAALAKQIAAECGVVPHEAYTAGLLHFVGKTLIDQSDPTAYDKVMHVVEKGAPERLAERIVFAVDHIDVAQEMFRRWRFAEELIAGLNYLDSPEITGIESKLAAVIHIADALVRVSRSGRPDEAARPVIADWALELLNVDPRTAEAWVQSAEFEHVVAAEAAA